MARFRYKARDKSGEVMTGTLESSGRDAVAMQISQLGYFPVRIEEASGWNVHDALTRAGEWFTQITPQDKIIMTRQMATLIDAGLSFVAVFDALIEQTTNPQLRAILGQVRRDVEGGQSFSSALAKHPAVFEELYVNMVRAGEEAGVLDEMLDRLAFLAEREVDTRAKIQAATRYPVIVIVALGVAFGILVTFVVPQFAKLYANVRMPLPLPTRMMIGLNTLIQSYGVVLLAAAAAGAFAWRSYVNTPRGRLRWDSLKLRVPVFGPLFLKSALSRFSRTFGTLNRCGFPALQALEIVGRTVGNGAVARAVAAIQDGARQGRGLVQPMKSTKLFPAGVVQMVAIGEETGQLESMLMKVSEYYDREVDYSIKNLSSALEPFLLVVIGAAVMFLALAIFLPWWNLIHVFKGGGG